MERLIGTPSVRLIDKIKNLVFAFVLVFLWTTGIVWFIRFLNIPYQVAPQLEFFLGCIVTPIAEEMYYRWAPITIAKTLDKRLLTPIVILTSLWFGYEHGNGSVSILIQGVGGFVLAWLFLKNKSIIWPILLHMAWNIYSIFLK